MMRFDICMHAEQVWNANWEEQNGGAMEGAQINVLKPNTHFHIHIII